jgi:hypothetical protein
MRDLSTLKPHTLLSTWKLAVSLVGGCARAAASSPARRSSNRVMSSARARARRSCPQRLRPCRGIEGARTQVRGARHTAAGGRLYHANEAAAAIQWARRGALFVPRCCAGTLAPLARDGRDHGTYARALVCTQKYTGGPQLPPRHARPPRPPLEGRSAARSHWGGRTEAARKLRTTNRARRQRLWGPAGWRGGDAALVL